MFLERRSYRRRRMADAARLLPLFGILLVCIPLLWQGGENPTRTTFAMFYLFAIWFVLAVVSGVISRYLRPESDRTDQDGVE